MHLKQMKILTRVSVTFMNKGVNNFSNDEGLMKKFLIVMELCAVSLALSVHAASAATIVNGDFENGLTGFTIRDLGAANPADLATIGTNGGNSFLKLEARPVTGGFGTGAEQEVTVDALHPVLSFDAAVLEENVLFNGNPSGSLDTLSVQAESALLDEIVFQINKTSTVDTFLTDLAPPPDVSAAPGAVFGPALSAFSVSADLSAFSGQTVDLKFLAFNFEPNVTQTFFGVDNVRFKPAQPVAPAPIPLPASIWFLLASCCALRMSRRGAA